MSEDLKRNIRSHDLVEGRRNATGVRQILTALYRIIDYARGLMNGHEARRDNPHGVSKEQVGLGNLPNAKSDSYDLDDASHLATSKAVHDAHDNLTEQLGEHEARRDNPHGVSKEQVGLGNLPNAKSDSYDLDDASHLATSKAVHDAHDNLTEQLGEKADATHAHDDRYYTENEVDNFFEGESGGKKQVDWSRVTNKPNLSAGSDSTKVSKSGDTMSGQLDMDGNSIIGLPEAMEGNDAATFGQLQQLASLGYLNKYTKRLLTNTWYTIAYARIIGTAHASRVRLALWNRNYGYFEISVYIGGNRPNPEILINLEGNQNVDVTTQGVLNNIGVATDNDSQYGIKIRMRLGIIYNVAIIKGTEDTYDNFRLTNFLTESETEPGVPAPSTYNISKKVMTVNSDDNNIGLKTTGMVEAKVMKVTSAPTSSNDVVRKAELDTKLGQGTTHETQYYSKREIDNFFVPGNTFGKKRINWINIQGKPDWLQDDAVKVLVVGSVSAHGQLSNVYKNIESFRRISSITVEIYGRSISRTMGHYLITHNIGHTRYIVHITPTWSYGAVKTPFIMERTSTFFRLMFTGGTNTQRYPSAFVFSIIGE